MSLLLPGHCATSRIAGGSACGTVPTEHPCLCGPTAAMPCGPRQASWPRCRLLVGTPQGCCSWTVGGLSQPSSSCPVVPWTGRAARFADRTATFHLARDRAQIRLTEAAVAAGRIPERPWVLGGEPTRVDPSRAPSGTHLAWAYCHVPAGCDADLSEAIVAEIQRCAPGFRDVIVGRIVTTATDLAAHNPNYVGGDINCGTASLRQLLARPVVSRRPHATPQSAII